MKNEELLYKIKDFLQRSSAHYNDLVARKKRDIEIASGNYWIDTEVDALDRKGRLNASFTCYPKYSNAMVSPFSRSPYHIDISDEKGLYKEVQDLCDKFENENQTKYVILQALRHASLTGVGFFILSILNGKLVPEIVRDVSCVALDPFMQELDGSDAEECAIVNFMSKKKAKRLYGNDVVDNRDECILSNFGSQWSLPIDSVPVISYYEMKDNKVNLYKVIGNLVVCDEDDVDHIEIPCSRIPVFRVCYNEIVRNNKIDYNGIVDMTNDLQKGMNIGFSQLLERANRTPKASYLMPVKAIDGLEDYYKKLHTKESLVTLYNGDVPPTPIVESYQTNDLMTTISTLDSLMSNVIGIPSQGINPIGNSQTATEILIQQNNSESNINSLYENAYNSIYSMSYTMLEILCWKFNLSMPEFKLINGPTIITKKMQTRQQLLGIANLLPPELQTIVAKKYIETMDSDISEPVVADIVANSQLQFVSDRDNNEDPLAINVMNKMNAVIEETQAKLEEVMMQAAQLEQENKELQLQLLNTKEQNLLNYQKMQNDYEVKMRELSIKEAEVKEDIQNDIVTNESKLAIEETKLEKELLDLEQKKLEIGGIV